MQTTSVQRSPDRATPKLREDWLIPVRARMNQELDRMGLAEIDHRLHPDLSISELVEHLVAVGLGLPGKPIRSLEAGELPQQ